MISVFNGPNHFGAGVKNFRCLELELLMQKMRLLKETFFSCLSISKVLQNLIRVYASANFGFNGYNRQTI